LAHWYTEQGYAHVDQADLDAGLRQTLSELVEPDQIEPAFEMIMATYTAPNGTQVHCNADP
jgi:hypothetical protein